VDPDGKSFREAMRAFVGNCSVITVGDGVEASGLVVTSAISLSADPPLLLACVNRGASSHDLLQRWGGSAGRRSVGRIRRWRSVSRASAA
jgi:flavin reductase (DIM6/NTAB) family NADH-FMN oxidoreductase RutF